MRQRFLKFTRSVEIFFLIAKNMIWPNEHKDTVRKLWELYLQSIYKFDLSICFYPINVKMAEPIEPKFFVGHHMTTGKVYE